MGKRIGYARVSTRQQEADRQVSDLLSAGVRPDDLYVDSGVSGGRASRPQFDQAVAALEEGDTLVITTLDRLGRSTQNMLAFAEALRGRGAGLRVLNLGGGEVDTATLMGSMVFTVMAALAQTELSTARERTTDSVARRRAAGKDLGGRRQTFTVSRVCNALPLIEGGGAGDPGGPVPRDVPGHLLPAHPRAPGVSRLNGIPATGLDGAVGVFRAQVLAVPQGSVRRPQRPAGMGVAVRAAASACAFARAFSMVGRRVVARAMAGERSSVMGSTSTSAGAVRSSSFR